ncbi:hypothetical protein V6N11_027371 [Hibiscus sabdariffa]|uniref:Uncharacterized protein n=1 Tax=Hibiscus sabdariffa TaxID=183260 RepID=A0ABR2PGT3_9ROSI
MEFRLPLLLLLLFLCMVQVPSETMIEEQKHTQIAESCAGRGAVYTRGKTCAKEHAEPAAPGANASRRAPQATGKGAGAAIRT